MMVYLTFIKIRKKKRGWYEYSNKFINCLVALDNCNKKNGTIELAKSDNLSFENLIKIQNKMAHLILKFNMKKN